MSAPLQVVWYTDPHNIWCWGCEPMIRRLEIVYRDDVELEIRQGGLFEDFGPMREQWARMSGGRWTDSVLAFFEAVSTQHRMPMDSKRMIKGVDGVERMAAGGGVGGRAPAGRSGPQRKGRRAQGAMGRPAARPVGTLGTPRNRRRPGRHR